MKGHPISEDLTDNLFINLAIDGNAKTIVSEDSHLLRLNPEDAIGFSKRGIVAFKVFRIQQAPSFSVNHAPERCIFRM